MRYLVVYCLAFIAAPLAGQEKIAITITGGKEDLTNVPVCVPIEFSSEKELPHLGELVGDDYRVDGQFTLPSLTTESTLEKPHRVRRDLHFRLRSVKAGQTIHLSNTGKPKMRKYPELVWDEKNVGDLLGDGGTRKILRYMNAAYDDSSKDKRDLSYKVFHHLFDPEGERLVTNGGPTGLFPHHRGLMYGFNRITYDLGKKADTWHCPPPVYVEHNKLLRQENGNVLGRHRVLIDWHGDKKTIFAKEERELTVYDVPGGTLVEFASRLKTTGGKVRLDGDPQHAGFQFRAANEVAEKTAKQTYYLRPDGKGKLGETRNWDPKTRKGPVDLPWYAMSFVLGDKRYTACYLNDPKNPKESRFSERDYGRFGCYFEYDLTEDNPLVVNYRLWLQEGEMTMDRCAALYRAFASPPTVSVK